MRDDLVNAPDGYESIRKDSEKIGFPMPSDERTGALLRTLAAARPAARILELGTGTGLSASWLLDGMDATSTLVSVDTNGNYQAIARRSLGQDSRIELITEDGLEFLNRTSDNEFDLIFGDTWPGKYIGFDQVLRVLKPGGVLLFDDMLPQPNWPADHPAKVADLLEKIASLPSDQFATVRMSWGTGHVLITKRA
jgi:predicted O-methyltransferase YrrM